MVNNDLLTDEEAEIVLLLGEVWNRFMTLPDEQHGSDQSEFMTTIHSAQAQVLMRTGRRQLYERARKQHAE